MKAVKAAVGAMLMNTLGPELTRRVVSHFDDLRTLMAYWISPLYRQSAARLQEYRGKHEGRRCFIIGNGPSLSKMDLTPLKDEITFGLNRIYLLFDRIGFSTTYFVCVNKYVIEQWAEEIVTLPCPKLIAWSGRYHVPLASDVLFIRSRRGPKFCMDIVGEGVWEGATVTYVAMQIAYYMGFEKVILIGVDHSFQSNGKPNQLVTSEADDVNHFHPHYFGKGFRWQLPDLEVSEIAYRLARDVYERNGRSIVDATVDGRLEIFPKVAFESLF